MVEVEYWETFVELESERCLTHPVLRRTRPPSSEDPCGGMQGGAAPTLHLEEPNRVLMARKANDTRVVGRMQPGT